MEAFVTCAADDMMHQISCPESGGTDALVDGWKRCDDGSLRRAWFVVKIFWEKYDLFGSVCELELGGRLRQETDHCLTHQE